MKIKVMTASGEQEVEISSSIPYSSEATAAYTALYNSNEYDSATGLGRITVGDTRIVFVKHENGVAFPIIFPGKKKTAKMALGIEIDGDTFYFQTALNQKRDKMESVTVVAGAAERTALDDAKGKFDAEYADSTKLNNLGILYRANTKDNTVKRPDGKPYFRSFIKEIIPVKVGGVDGSLVIVKPSKSSSHQVFYVAAPVDRASALVDEANFMTTLSPVAVKQITVDSADKTKMEITPVTGAPLTGVEYHGASADVTAELNGFEDKLGDAYERGVAVAPSLPKGTILSGVNAQHTQGFFKNKRTVNDCFIVAPHATQPGVAMYVVHGATIEALNGNPATPGNKGLDLTPDEFQALLRKEDYGTARYITVKTGAGVEKSFVKTGDFETDDAAFWADTAKKDVTGIEVVGLQKIFATAGETTVRPMRHRKNQFLSSLSYELGLPEKKYTLTTSTDLMKDLEDGAGLPSGTLGGYNKPVKHAITAHIVPKRILEGLALVGLTLAIAAGAGAFDEKVDAFANGTISSPYTYSYVLGQNESTSYLETILALQATQSQDIAKAVESGRNAAGANVAGMNLIGNQYADGTWDLTGLDMVLNKTLNFYQISTDRLSYTITSVNEMTEEEARAVAENGGHFIRVEEENEKGEKVVHYLEADESKQIVKVTETLTLTDEELAENGLSKSFTAEETAAYLETVGAMVADEAMVEKKPVLKYNSEGAATIVYTYGLGSREAMVAKFGEDAVKAYEKGFGGVVKEAAEQDKIGASAIEDDRAILESKEVLAAAAKIAGENAVVMLGGENGEIAYVRSEDGSTIVKVEVSGDITKLANDLQTATNDEKETFFCAANVLKSVYPGQEEILQTRFGNTYVSGNPESKNSVTTYRAHTLTVEAGGMVTEGDGCYVQAKSSNFKQSEAVAVSLMPNASIGNRSNYKTSETGEFSTSATESKTK